MYEHVSYGMSFKIRDKNKRRLRKFYRRFRAWQETKRREHEREVARALFRAFEG